MNIITEIYNQLLQKHDGKEKEIKGLTSSQMRSYREGFANPTIRSVKELLLKNELPTSIVIKNGKTKKEILL